MKRNISIQVKAALLLIVFSMNMVLGFTCAVGIDMGFNTKHHEDETAAIPVHDHADGKKHQHNDEATNHHHDSKENSEKGGCCNDGVIKFQILDKTFAQNSNVAINTPVFVAMLSSYFGIDIFKQTQTSTPKYIVRFFHPPPPDIRILIQSFQI